MSRDYKVFLGDILDAISAIRKYTAGLGLKTFAEDTKTRDAIIRNLEVIGEAVKKVPEHVRAKHTAVDWKKIAVCETSLSTSISGSTRRSSGTSSRTSCLFWRSRSKESSTNKLIRANPR